MQHVITWIEINELYLIIRDIPDACSDAFSFLASKLVLPNFLGSVQQFQSAIGEPKIVSL